MINFIVFVLSLKEKSVKYQFKNYVAAINGSLYLSTAISGVMFAHFSGLFWGVYCMNGVGCNDLWAYFMGKTFGKTQLIALSPNKTLEGFLGGAVWTCIFSVLMLQWAYAYPSLLCES